MLINENEYYTEQQLADHLQLKLTTIRSWRLKKLPPNFIKFNRAVRYSGKEILKLQDGGF
jgi:hypothetical protein